MAQKQENDSFRWWVLAVTALGMLGYGYAYDNVVALQTQLLHTYDLSNVQYNLLYSIYTFPNMILPTIAGVLADKYGYNFLLIFLFGLMVLGQAIYILGCYLNGFFYIMLTGRLILGIGAESHALVETPLIYDYFKGKELAFAYAFHLSLARVGSSLNDICSYLAYTHFNGSQNMKIVFAGAIALFVLVISWICIILLIMVHKVRRKRKKALQRKLRKQLKKENKYIQDDISSLSSITGACNSNMDASITSKTSLVSPLISGGEPQKSIKVLHHEDVMNINERVAQDSVVRRGSIASLSTVKSKMKMSDIKQFDLVFWLLTWNCSIMYAIMLSWMNVGSDYLQTTYGYSHGTANSILSIPYTIAAVLGPIWGWISDKYGKRSQLLLVASVLFVGAHYIFGWFRVDNNPLWVPIAALALMGVGFSIFTAVIWSTFPFVVPERAITTAYGLPVSGYNLISTISFILVGTLTSDIDNEDKYAKVEYLLLIASISSVVTSLWLIYKDKQTGWRLYVPNYKDTESEETSDLYR